MDEPRASKAVAFGQLRRSVLAAGVTNCKTVGLAYDGSNPSPATTSETARGRGFPPPRGPSCLVSSCVIPGQETSPHHGGYGHMADGIGTGGAVHRTACSWIAWPTVPHEEARQARSCTVVRRSRGGWRLRRQ